MIFHNFPVIVFKVKEYLTGAYDGDDDDEDYGDDIDANDANVAQTRKEIFTKRDVMDSFRFPHLFCFFIVLKECQIY